LYTKNRFKVISRSNLYFHLLPKGVTPPLNPPICQGGNPPKPCDNTQAQTKETVTKQGPKIMNLVQYLYNFATIGVISGHTRSFKVTTVKEQKSFKFSTVSTSTNPVTNTKKAFRTHHNSPYTHKGRFNIISRSFKVTKVNQVTGSYWMTSTVYKECAYRKSSKSIEKQAYDIHFCTITYYK